MNRAIDIVVVGAGTAGLGLAALLARSAEAARMRILVIDAGAAPHFDAREDVAPRVLAIAPGSAAMLDDVGAWQAILDARFCAYDHMRVWDENDAPDGPGTLRFDAEEFAVPHLGYIVENVLVQYALCEVVRGLDVDVRFGESIASLEETERGYRLALASGDRIDAELVVGADGGRSFVREALGISVERHPYGQSAFVTHLQPEVPHAATARQRFLRDGPLGMLPLADGRISIIWSTSRDNVDGAMACSDAELGRLLTSISDGVLGELRVAGPRGTFPLAAQHARNYVRRGAALIGDAAHTVHPLAGQGANLGLQDATTLAAVVTAALAAGENPADRPVLRRYERARRGPNATMMHFMTGLNRLFASDSAVLGEMRRMGMQLFNLAGPVRERVVGVALGAGRQ